MSKNDIWPYLECQNRFLNAKIRYSPPFRMLKKDFECQNAIFCLSLNVNIGFCMSKYDIQTDFE